MESMTPYAHTRPDRPPDDWQPLEEHLRAVAIHASGFAEPFASADWAWNAGWLHDLGKATTAFQHYLKKNSGLDDPDYDADGSVSNHASTGAAFAEDELRLPGRVLAYLIAGHHAGLPDWHSAETGNAALPCRLPEGRNNLETIRAYAAKVGRQLRPLARPPPFVKPQGFHLWIRMLFSCLVDADRLNTEEFGDNERHSKREVFPTLGDLAPRLFQALETLERAAADSDVNRIRAEIRRACETAAGKPPGLFSLTVPTGGGKTLSAMAFALRHALKHGKRRIVYVIPYTSIIEQTAQTLAGIFGRENVIEHHSNLAPEHETERSQMAAENWDAPIVVTTNVQFFESLYAAKTGPARKLHNIVNSVVILDEAQLLPPELLTPCVDAMNRLVESYGVTIVLATATQPALPRPEKPVEIIPPEMRLYERLKRTDIHLPSDLNQPSTWEEIAARLLPHDQVLCIVNTRRDCHDLFELMPEGSIHLSALMCGAHRSAVIDDIKRRLKAEKPCRVISTQLVEAGVDIDFPVVYRALAGLPSIAQAAGRCDREGKLTAAGQFGQVHVFVPPKKAPLGLLRKGEDTVREMTALDGFDPQAQEFLVRYFALFYSRLNDTGSRFDDWLVRDVNPKLEIQFRTAGNDFRIVDDSAQQSVLVRWGENPAWLAQLRGIGPTRENLRALQRSCVNLSQRVFLGMKLSGNVEEIHPGFWLWIGRYDAIRGLDAFGDGYSPEELVG
ncbi:MAG: CRISPR-associated endonuclease Cas3'' [Verrucomicrobia bacterium A1]|nr:MAG: CRISPR-associated endonuclease Cas3'' [Verrucomicrobia bacterium A1]